VVAGAVSNFGYDFNYWQDVDDLSASAIGAAYLGDSAPLYLFVAGRLYGDDTAGTSAATKQGFTWGTGTTRVLFDSAGIFPVGSELTNSIEISSYQMVIVERVA